MLIDAPLIDKNIVRRGYLAPIPETGWKPVSEFPTNFANAIRLAYDVETRETDLEHGAG